MRELHTQLSKVIAAQRTYFSAGKTRAVSSRVDALRQLRLSIHAMEGEISAALHEDLGKSAAEGYMTEIGTALSDLSYFIGKTAALAKGKTVLPALSQMPGRGSILPEPYDAALIISPWNYPFLLAISPLAAAIAAGNTVVLKPSELAPATSRVLCKLIDGCLPSGLCTVAQGGTDTAEFLLEQRFDTIFFTGSSRVGKIVYEKAARKLTPVTLELGGKSPCIVDETAKLKLAARRIVFGKFLNCGQTCVAPDYLYVHESVQEKLFDCLKAEIARQYGKEPLENPQYGRIINAGHFRRLSAFLSSEQVAFGGEQHEEALQIAPTLLRNVSLSDAVMQEEIFGPILPILPYASLDTVMAEIAAKPKPLALYLFSENRKTQKRVMENLSFGGGCVNDTILHLSSHRLPFGGVGESGIGAYHGAFGFQAFSHYKGVLHQSTRLDVPLRYAPYGRATLRLLRRILR